MMYDEYYGLNDKPFQLTPDPRFYFESATHRKAMAYLGYGLAQGEGFIVITGEIGAGKTTLVGHLMATVDPARVNAVSIVSTQVEGDDMLRMAAHGLGIETAGADKALLLSKIDMTLQERVKTGQRTLLIVDEAQNLTTSALEELRMLSNFQSGASAMLQILLLGQPEFRERLNSAPDLEQLRQRVIATHHLTPMEAEEVGPYLAHRLKLVGWNGKPQFTEEAVAALQQHSGGLPRKLNTLASRVLLLGAVEKASVIDEVIVDAVVADLARDTGTEMTPVAPTFVEPEQAAEARAKAIVPALPEDFVSEPPVAVAPAVLEATVAPIAANTVPYSAVVPPAPVAVALAAAPQPVSAAFSREPDFEPMPEEPSAVETLAPATVEAPKPVASIAPVAPVTPDTHVLDLKARVAMLEAQVEEQDAALRRVLALLVEWVENEEKSPVAQTVAA